MSDNVDLPAATGKAATDKVTYSGDTADVQLVRLVNVAGAEGSKTVNPFRDLKAIAVASSGLTTATTAYAAGDQTGALFTLADAAADSGGGGTIVGVTLVDASDVIGSFDLVIFDSSVTLAADNAAFSISGADAAKIVSVIPVLGPLDLGANRVALAQNVAVPYVCSGSANLYAALITRSANAVYAAGATSLTLRVFVERN